MCLYNCMDWTSFGCWIACTWCLWETLFIDKNVCNRGMIEDLSFGIFCLFVVGCWGFCLFVLDCSNASGKVLVILHTDTAYVTLSCCSEAEVSYTVQLCLEGGSSLVTFCSSPKRGCFCGFGSNSLSSLVSCTENC